VATTEILHSDPVLAEHADAIRALGKRFIADVIEIGARLRACRTILKDDRGWRAWLEQELRLSPQSAGRYIQVHELAQQRSNLERSALSVSAFYLLAAPSTPEAARTEIIARAEAGEVLPVAEIKQKIDTAKGHKQPATRRQTERKPNIAKRAREDIGPAGNGEIAHEVEETKAGCQPEGEDEGSELGNLLDAWDRASHGAREKFKKRVRLVAADGLDIPDYLDRRAAR
jgi:hypothetical protein